MNHIMRGWLEQTIEAETSLMKLEAITAQMSSLPSKNLEDLIFGAFIGYLFGAWTILMQQRKRSTILTNSDLEEFWVTIRKRTL
jgi:hypothetical protein